MTDEELLEYVRNKKCFCCFCAELKQQVLENGVKAIDEYEGMICGGVAEIFRKRGRY